MIEDSVGNRELLSLKKTAFLCSRKVPAGIVLKCYDWAIEQREQGNCVISGFHSTIEKDVFHYLLKGKQPIIIALHRGIGPEITKIFAEEINAGRVLIISPFKESKRRGGERDATIRNNLMINIADEIVIGHASAGGNVETLLGSVDKPVSWLGNCGITAR